MEKRWKDGEEIFIIRNWHEMSNNDMAKHFGVEPSQVATKKQQLKIKYNNGKTPKEEEIYDVIDKCIEGQMARKLGVTWSLVYGRKEKLAEEGLIDKWEKQQKEIKPRKILPEEIQLKERIPVEVVKEQEELKRKIDTLDGNLELGRRYKIKELDYNKKKGQKKVTGELIQITDKHYTFKNRYAESFLKIDFILGEYAIEEA